VLEHVREQRLWCPWPWARYHKVQDRQSTWECGIWPSHRVCLEGTGWRKTAAWIRVHATLLADTVYILSVRVESIVTPKQCFWKNTAIRLLSRLAARPIPVVWPMRTPSAHSCHQPQPTHTPSFNQMHDTIRQRYEQTRNAVTCTYVTATSSIKLQQTTKGLSNKLIGNHNADVRLHRQASCSTSFTWM
jgi:hypothetical protein